MRYRNLLLSVFILCLTLAVTNLAGAQGTQSTAPSANQGTSSPGSANSGQTGQRSVEDELQLTPDQKQKIAEVVDDENKQITAVRNDTSLSMDQKQQKVLQIRQEGSPKIKAILTPEQLQKLAAIQQRMRDQQQGGQGQTPQQSAPPSNPPQSTPPPSTPPQSTPPQSTPPQK